MVNDTSVAYLLALNQVRGLGPVRLKKLLSFYNDPKLAWEATEKGWTEAQIPVSVIAAWKNSLQTINPESLLSQLNQNQIKIITLFDENYPTLLKEIPDPPVVIYYKGNESIFNSKSVAVVGTRKITAYGKLVTEKFTLVLASSGLVIVSGLARGVDSVAHRETLNCQGKTIAVMGGGLNNIFPPDNWRLSEEIINSGGLVITEFKPDEPSLPGNFPARNRIISGLALAVLVTEAAEDSGSLITARLALDFGREVFSIPGPITSSQSQGNLQLIKNGASLITSPEEILDFLKIDSKIGANTLNLADLKLTGDEQSILSCLEVEAKHIDTICQELNLPSSVVASSLIKMEIIGIVKSLGRGNYLKVC